MYVFECCGGPKFRAFEWNYPTSIYLPPNGVGMGLQRSRGVNGKRGAALSLRVVCLGRFRNDHFLDTAVRAPDGCPCSSAYFR